MYLHAILRREEHRACRSLMTFSYGFLVKNKMDRYLIFALILKWHSNMKSANTVESRISEESWYCENSCLGKYPFKKLFLFEISTLFDPSFLLLLLKGHLCRTEIIDLHNPKLHHRERREGSRWLQLWASLLRRPFVYVRACSARSEICHLSCAIVGCSHIHEPLDARGMGTGALLWSLLLRH